MGLKSSLESKTILSVKWDSDRVWFETDFGPVTWVVEGECCSTSWIEAADLEHLVGQQVLEVATVDLPWVKETEDREKDDDGYRDNVCLQYYGIEIRTAKDLGAIDFRNSSNGYYGGSMYVEEPSGDRSYYD